MYVFCGMHMIHNTVKYIDSQVVGLDCWFLGELPSIDDQKKWIDDNLVKFDPIPWFPGPVVQPFADDIAKYMGVLPDESDFADKSIYQRWQNERMFATQYRIKGHGKTDNALELLQKQMDSAATETMENQSLVTGVDIQDLEKAYHY